MDPLERLSLSINTSTWNRDSHGLFDYESDNVNNIHLFASQACFVVRKESEVKLLYCDPSPDEIVLARVEPYGHGFRVISCEMISGEALWQVVKSSERETIGMPIEPGTTVKLGRVQILVSELAKETSPGASTLSSDDEMEEEQKTCKICFGASDEMNCLISPCDCSGSVRYVHLECLQRWLTSKCQVTDSENFKGYFWKSMHCELCKKIYPFMLNAGGRKVSLFNVSKSEGLTLALELLARDNHGQAVHILSTKENVALKLGRGHESDLRISDISVSRCHAILSIRSDKYFIKDYGSKFGTLIKLPNEVFISKGSSLVVQTGRSVLTFHLPLS
mmetsp:Transcript_24771/g.43632  ORF Transcript_24771/g.43632 Transcript_24771/m.43632 type:complete len:334 (-) Transcript_24771:1472-2473(-)|eukprot:CAMPEP_0204906302 /NCGR_PEP_ID=MMETSP1397-20131031/5904_1 /ASSEMBLY_ACC=CAM_ASM_000891 /TAXON_ID=49980 /ORGANISM="Climacostomum Climacostomum virens, Strain Stock W-24" /LENGTH=333 /DNA_ID=CAMNT_0052075289 /DNA_START=404 /DNA_END=1405 /DNA_ORIENTATION=-